MYLGEFMLGDRVPLGLMCQEPTGLPVLPDAAPYASVMNTDGEIAVSLRVPPQDVATAPGVFGIALHLDSRFSIGRYSAHYSWTDGGESRVGVDVFDVIPGGHPDGAIIALYPYHRPQAEFLIQQTDGRKLLKGRNPTV